MTEAVKSPDTPEFERALQAQAEAAHPDQSAWVEANAGSGKTKVLIDRVTRLLLRRPDGRAGAPANSILCITYTKAAANEMLSRLFARLGDWSVLPDEALRGALARLEGRQEADYRAEDLRQARALFAQALETPGGLRIETIHAFCARILRRFPLEAGISPGFREMEDQEADELWEKVLYDRLIEAAAAHPEAISCLSDVTGGRGVQAALEALKPKRQALLTFHRKAGTAETGDQLIRTACGAGERPASQIIEQAMMQDLPEADILAAIAELSEQEDPGKSDVKLLEGLRRLIDTQDTRQRYQIYLSLLAGRDYKFPSASNPFTKDAGMMTRALFARDTRNSAPEGREISRLKQTYAAVCAAEAAERTSALMEVGLPMVEAYAEIKRTRSVLDFDDLIARTRDLLTRSNSAEWVLYKLDGGLTHLLLDEAQDTSPDQWALINALVEEFQSGLANPDKGEPRTQFVVGDPKQSIYSFQGANQERFIAEAERFVQREQPVAQIEGRQVNRPEMAMSFRSTPEVLAFVDAVRRHVPLDKAETDPLPAPLQHIREHSARRRNQAGRVDLWPLEQAEAPSDDESHWSAPTDHRPANAPRRKLASKIACTLRDMLRRGEMVWKEEAKGVWCRQRLQPQDILILVRRRNDLFEGLIESLKQQNIPVAGADRLRLLENLGVQDCLNLIRFVLQPADDLVLAEILRGPFCGLVDDDAHLFVLAHGRKRGETLWQRLQKADQPCFEPARTLCQRLLSWRSLPAFEFLSQALNSRWADGFTGWDQLVRRLGEPVRDPVAALLQNALGHDMSGPASLQTWLSDIESQDKELKRELGEAGNAVRVMTVHGAKGLQAPLVILPDTTGSGRLGQETLFFDASGVPVYSPSKKLDCTASQILRQAGEQAAEKESRRLLYVALTRASDRLIIAGAALTKPKEGYGKSAWYRWCLLAMKSLIEADEAIETVPRLLSLGPEPVCDNRSDPDALGPLLDDMEDRLGAPYAWLFQPAPETSPPLRLAAPSRLVEDKSAGISPFGESRQKAMRRGQLIHELLQILPLQPEPERQATGEAFLARAQGLSLSEAGEILRTSLEVLNTPGFEAIFQAGGRSEVALVGTLPGGQMVNGRIDRLLITQQDVLIVDYKTDRPAPRRSEDVSPAYLVQMAAYRAVLQALYQDGRPVRCALLYTDGPKLIELDPDRLSESLKGVKSPV